MLGNAVALADIALAEPALSTEPSLLTFPVLSGPHGTPAIHTGLESFIFTRAIYLIRDLLLAIFANR